MSSTTELRNAWEARVTAFKASGQSTKDWCAAQDLKVSQLRYWLRKLDPHKPNVQSSQWLSVEVGEAGTGSHDNALFIKVGKATIEVRPGFDPTLLSNVVRTLANI